MKLNTSATGNNPQPRQPKIKREASPDQLLMATEKLLKGNTLIKSGEKPQIPAILQYLHGVREGL